MIRRRLSTHGGLGKIIKGVVSVVTALTMVGCATVGQQIPPLSELDLGQPPAAGWTADKLVGILANRDEQFQSLRSLASIYYRGPEASQKFQEAILVQRPDKVRLETLTLLGAVLIVTVNGDQIAGLHPREGLYLRGKSSKENLYRYTRIPLELNEMTRLLIGLPPVATADNWRMAGNSLYRELKGSGKEIVVFDLTQDVPIQWYRLGSDGSPELRAAFGDFSATPAGLFPSRITLEAPDQKRSLEIVYQEPEVNVEIVASFFSQEKPANAQEVPIEALEQ